MGTGIVSTRRWWFVAIAVALVACLVAFSLRPLIEQGVRARIESAAARHGMVARIAAVHVGAWPLLRLQGLDLDLGHGMRLQAGTVDAAWLGTLRLEARAATFSGPAGLTASAAATAWKATGLFGDEPRLALLEPRSGLALHRQLEPGGSAWAVEAQALDLGRLLAVRSDAGPLLDGGIADGRVDLHYGPDSARFDFDIGVRGLRLGALAGNDTEDAQLGDPTDVTLRFTGDWDRRRNSLEVPGLRASVAGAEFSGSLAVLDLDADPAVDLVLGVKRLDFAQLLGTSGLAVPASLGLPAGGNHDLGNASIELRVHGRLAEPAALAVSQKIDHSPPRELPPGIARLRGDFPFTVADGTGEERVIDVSPESLDYIALHDVPPLFLRALLLSEDAGFWGHRGIDLRELPSALVTNWTRGGAARGASTITQQLAKNLFLSRDKQLGRKLQELAITFLLESALGKERILEIYLNIIEWGPDLRGLRPAARHYFGRDPRALTPAQMAFLVAIIPGPTLYQRSIAGGTPSPALRALIDNLLAKLRSVDAISEAEYQRALAEPLLTGSARPVH